MDRKIKVELTPDLIRWLLFYQFLPLLALSALLTLFCVGQCGLMLSAGRGWDPRWAVGFLWPGFFVVFVLGLAVWSYFKTLAQIRKMKSSTVRYRVTDRWLYASTPLASGRNDWAVFKGLRRHSRMWRVLTPQNASFIFPAECLDEKLRKFLSDKLPARKRGWRLLRWLGWAVLGIVVYYFLSR